MYTYTFVTTAACKCVYLAVLASGSHSILYSHDRHVHESQAGINRFPRNWRRHGACVHAWLAGASSQHVVPLVHSVSRDVRNPTKRYCKHLFTNPNPALPHPCPLCCDAVDVYMNSLKLILSGATCYLTNTCERCTGCLRHCFSIALSLPLFRSLARHPRKYVVGARRFRQQEW